jgi:dihydroxy-acid dehydratase
VMKLEADDSVSDADLLAIEKGACPTCGSCSGMYTANSMNCLTEAIGMGLPGNGTLLATHVLRRRLYEKAAKRIVEMTEEYYVKGNKAVLPKSIAVKAAFENAMALDIAMGGSTNTVLHILAVAREAGVDFTMKDIDALSRKVPNICKVAPSSPYHVEDVNRAGGITGIMAELHKAGLIKPDVITVGGKTMLAVIRENDVYGKAKELTEDAKKMHLAAPAGKRTGEAMCQDSVYPDYDMDRTAGCIRDIGHPYNKDGGLAVLYGNIATSGSIVKTAGVDKSIYQFKGKARVFDSQEQSVEAILANKIKPGDIVVIRYEGPIGGPGMQEMLYPTTYLKSKKLDAACALLTDGRFSGGTAGLSIGHVYPEAAEGGLIALVQDGDLIEIDIPARKIELKVLPADLKKREKALKAGRGFKPNRERTVSKALQLYSMFATSADKGAVRDTDKIKA